MKLRSQMCATCPFRKGSPYAHLEAALTESAMTEASRICHSTGSNAINAQTRKPSALCRGARNVQLQLFASIGFIDAPTDEAWAKRCRDLALTEPEIE